MAGLSVEQIAFLRGYAHGNGRIKERRCKQGKSNDTARIADALERIADVLEEMRNASIIDRKNAFGDSYAAIRFEIDNIS